MKGNNMEQNTIAEMITELMRGNQTVMKRINMDPSTGMITV